MGRLFAGCEKFSSISTNLWTIAIKSYHDEGRFRGLPEHMSSRVVHLQNTVAKF